MSAVAALSWAKQVVSFSFVEGLIWSGETFVAAAAAIPTNKMQKIPNQFSW